MGHLSEPGGGGGGGAPTDAPYATVGDAHVALPNSRQLLAGANVTFDDSVPNERTINAAAGGIISGTFDATFDDFDPPLTISFAWQKVGNLVNIQPLQNLTGNLAATVPAIGCAPGTIPPDLCPIAPSQFYMQLQLSYDNDNEFGPGQILIQSDGSIVFLRTNQTPWQAGTTQIFADRFDPPDIVILGAPFSWLTV